MVMWPNVYYKMWFYTPQHICGVVSKYCTWTLDCTHVLYFEIVSFSSASEG